MIEISTEAQLIKQTISRDTLDSTSIVEKREAWEAAARSVEIPAGVKTDICILGGIRCALHTCKDGHNSKQLIVYLHGGGLVEGSVETSREWCCRLAKTAKFPVLAIDYSLAPEQPYPSAINEVIAVCNAIADDEHFSLLSVGGDSTGCVLALGALMHLRDNQKPMPTSCFFLSPSLDLSFAGESIKTNSAQDILVSREVLIHYANLYAGAEDVSDSKISPLFGSLLDLPPVMIQVDKSELVLDDATRLHEGVLAVGGIAQLIVAQGLWHVWPTWGDFPEARRATQEIVKHIGRYRVK